MSRYNTIFFNFHDIDSVRYIDATLFDILIYVSRVLFVSSII